MSMSCEDDGGVESIVQQYADVLYKCRMCQHTPCVLADRVAFVQHIRDVHLSTSTDLQPCSRCNLRFSNKDDLNLHIGLAHHESIHAHHQQAAPYMAAHKIRLKKMAPQSYQVMPDQASDSNSIQSHSSEIIEPVHSPQKQESAEQTEVKTFDLGNSPQQEDWNEDDLDLDDELDNYEEEVDAEEEGKDEKKRNEVPMRKRSYYESIISSMRAECAMINLTRLQGGAGLATRNLHSMSKEELQAIFGKYSSTIRINSEPYFYCQVCMYKTNIEDNFHAHFTSGEHLETVTKMEQSINMPSGQKYNCKGNNSGTFGFNAMTKRPHYSVICSETVTPIRGNFDDGHLVATEEQSSCVSAQQGAASGFMAEASGYPLALHDLEQLASGVSQIVRAPCGQPILHISNDLTEKIVSLPEPTSEKLETHFTTTVIKESIIEHHLKDVLVDVADGEVSRNHLLEVLQSHIRDHNGIVQWATACNNAVRHVFPTVELVRRGSAMVQYYKGVQLKEQTVGTVDHVRTPRNIGLTDRIFGVLPDILHFTGKTDDCVARTVIMELLSQRFNQPEVFYWGPQCNKVLRELFPSVEIKRKGSSKAYFHGVRLQNKPQTTDAGDQAETQITTESQCPTTSTPSTSVATSRSLKQHVKCTGPLATTSSQPSASLLLLERNLLLHPGPFVNTRTICHKFQTLAPSASRATEAMSELERRGLGFVNTTSLHTVVFYKAFPESKIENALEALGMNLTTYRGVFCRKDAELEVAIHDKMLSTHPYPLLLDQYYS